MREYIEERVDNYIQQEIHRLEEESKVCAFDKERFKIQLELETISDKEKQEIIDKVVNSEALYNMIEEDINYYLYHK